MKTRVKKIGFIIILISTITSCEFDKCFHGTGATEIQLYQPDSFEVAIFYSTFDIELISDSVYYVELEDGGEILKNISIELVDDTLRFWDYNSCYWMRERNKTKVRLHFPALKSMIVNKACKVYSNKPITSSLYLKVPADLSEVDLEFNCENLYFYSHRTSGGIFRFSGSVTNCRLMGFYIATIDASELRCTRLGILNESIADFKVWAEDKLTVEIYNKGNIYYKGNPEIVLDSITGTGQLIRMDSVSN